jgi:hypothetical protein
MTVHALHPLADDYLHRLKRAGRRLPRGRLKELTAEIEGHLAEATSPEASEAEVLTALDRLGEPEAIVDAEQPRTLAAEDPRGTQEWAAIFLLLFGGFFVGIGWLIGLVLLWSSRAWTARDKWIGTLVLPGGLTATIFLALILGSSSGQSCYGVPGGSPQCTGRTGGGTAILPIVFLAMLVLAPIGTAIYLARRAR